MSKMQLRMEAESGRPQELPTLQNAAGCNSEGVSHSVHSGRYGFDGQSGYPMCKHGHVKSPDNVYTDGHCKQCARGRQKIYLQRPGALDVKKARTKIYKQKPEARARDREWRKEHRQKPKVKEYMKKYCAIYYQAQEVKDRQKVSRKAGRVNLADYYVAKSSKIPINETTTELIKLARANIQLKREIKNANNQKHA